LHEAGGKSIIAAKGLLLGRLPEQAEDGREFPKNNGTVIESFAGWVIRFSSRRGLVRKLIANAK
jgi:hypothetical protein